MTKWWILLAAAAVAEISFGVYIWSYRPVLPSEAVYASMEAAQESDLDALDAVLRARDAAPDPRAVWTSYVGALHLEEFEAAYGMLSRRSQAAFEAAGGLVLFKKAQRSAPPRFDLGKTLTLAQEEKTALIAAREYDAPKWSMVRLRQEGGRWRIETRPSPDNKRAVYPSR